MQAYLNNIPTHDSAAMPACCASMIGLLCCSVVEFLQGMLGQPEGGFPEPLRSRVIKVILPPKPEKRF